MNSNKSLQKINATPLNKFYQVFKSVEKLVKSWYWLNLIQKCGETIMGVCSDNMKSKRSLDLKKKNPLKAVLGSFRPRKKDTPEIKSADFAQLIEAAEDKLVSLITTKEAELNSEKGQESYNTKALAHLKTMGFHLDMLIDSAESYGDLRK